MKKEVVGHKTNNRIVSCWRECPAFLPRQQDLLKIKTGGKCHLFKKMTLPGDR
jgi:hypothetical protein